LHRSLLPIENKGLVGRSGEHTRTSHTAVL